jgi:hypothetical protein
VRRILDLARKLAPRPGRALGLAGALACAAALAAPARGDVPYPTCADSGCSDPADFASYLFLAPGVLPDDYDPGSGEAWKYAAGSGMDIVGAWQTTTGRPDVVIAVLDSGIEWDRADLARKVALNPGELPVPEGCAALDCNGDGFVSVDDFEAACAADANGNGLCDGQDLLAFYSDGVDDDGNGFVDDIAGWDFQDDDNDPSDDVRYGHGTGEASDEVAEADNGSGFPGFAPSSFFLPLKVSDSFVAIDQDFLQAVVYAADRKASVISEALGTVNASASGQAAVDYAWRRGIPILASAADEESRHHNYPANYDHVIWVNSVRHGDGTFLDADANGYDLLNGCTNYGGKAWVAIPSTSCSSEATARAGGLVALLVAHGRNQIDRGLFSPYPGLDTPFSAEEVRQLLRLAARDVDHADDLSVVLTGEAGLFNSLLSATSLGLVFGSARFPTQPGWDAFTGYGRPDAPSLLARVTPTTMPPEADLAGGPRWFEVVRPERSPDGIDVVGSARAARAGHVFDWVLEVGCGVQPTLYQEIAAGVGGGAPIEQEVLARWDPRATQAACLPASATVEPDTYTVTLRLRVTDGLGNVGEDRRTLSIHRDPTLRFTPRRLEGSGESTPALADVDRDGVLDVVAAGGDGRVHVVDGATGADLPGFPASTAALDVHPSPAWGTEVPVPHEAVIAAAAADDLDGDGRTEIVVAGLEGRLYVFDDHGRPRAGFPVATDPALSDPANRDPLNDTDPGLSGAPTLVDLDPPGPHPALEIAVSGLDGHLYAWRADGTPVPGFPVRLADPARVTVDPATGRATPRPGVTARERAAKSVSSPAAGDLDGDGRPELVVATNEEYGDEPDGFALESTLLRTIRNLLGDDALSFDVQGRVYAVRPDGTQHPGGPFLPGWPVAVPLLAPGLLPTVATGTPGAPALADVDGTGELRVAIFAAIGPVLLLEPDGSSALGELDGRRRALAVDFPAPGFPVVPAAAGSADAPFFGALGSGAFGDLTGDGLPEYAAPTGGMRRLLDVSLPAQQGLLTGAPGEGVVDGFADHQVSAWNPRTGALLPAFPRVMDDMQFISTPTLADVDGDGRSEILAGSGAYLLRAYRADGTTPAGWPKFTHGWILASPTAGDVDGDGRIEVVAATREGELLVWDTPAPATASAVQWSGYGRDRRNTQNQASGVATAAAATDPLAGLAWALEDVGSELEALADSLGEPDATRLSRSPAPWLLPRALDAIADDAELAVAATLPGLEWGLRLPPHPIAGLAPLHERLVAAVGETLERFRDQTRCKPASARCQRAVAGAHWLVVIGRYLHGIGDDRGAVLVWSHGIGLFDGVDGP